MDELTPEEMIRKKRQAQQEHQKKREEQIRQEKQDKLNSNPGGVGRRIKPLPPNELERILKTGTEEEKSKAFFENGRPRNWEELSYDKTKINKDKKTILVFPGDASVEPFDANFYAKFVESLVGRAEENGFDLYSFYHDKFEKNKRRGTFSDKHLEKIYKSFVEPLIKDENGKFFKEKEIAKNFGNLRFVTHCFGDLEVDKLLVKTSEVLAEKFDEEKTQQLLSNVFVVGYAPWIPFHKFGTHVQFHSKQDKNLMFPDKKLEALKDFEGFAKIFEEPLKNSITVISDTFADFSKSLDEHQIALLLKEGGVIDRLQFADAQKLSKQKQEELKSQKKNYANNVLPRTADYSRQQAISDMFASVLAYSIVTDNLSLEDVKMILQAQINMENKIWPEQKRMKKETEKKRQKDLDVNVNKNSIEEELKNHTALNPKQFFASANAYKKSKPKNFGDKD